MVKYWQASFLLWLVHLPLLWFFEGEFTDGVLQTVYFQKPLYVCAEGTEIAWYVPPLYPGFIWITAQMGIPPLGGGRMISLIAYALTAWILAQTGFALSFGLGFPLNRGEAHLSARGVGWLAGAAWALSPMTNRWALHAMTDMPFCLFATASLSCYLLASVKGQLPWEQNGSGWKPSRIHLIWGGTLLGILSLWTRYQGMALMGAGLLSFVLTTRNGAQTPHEDDSLGRKRCHLHSLVLLGNTLLWIASIFLIRQGLGIHAEQFAQRSVYQLGYYRDFAMAAFRYLPYATTPPLLFLALYGIYRVSRHRGNAAIWILSGLVAGLVGLEVQTSFLSFQFRYGLPFLPWVCLLAVLGAATLKPFFYRRSVELAGLWLLAMTVAVLYFQHETFADIYRVSRRVPEFLQAGQQVWACEEYNPSFQNVKTSVWSGLPVKWLDEQSLREVKEGDLIIDSNVYLLPPTLRQELRVKWRLERVAEAESETRPLFPGEVLIVQMDLGSGPVTIRSTSQPELLAYRYQPQFYYTQLYRVTRPERDSSVVPKE